MELKPKIEGIRLDKDKEKEIFTHWSKGKTYLFNPKSKKKIFSIDTPPPYPSGRPWHIGAAAHYSQIDMIARTGRMMGFETYFPIGIDRNGIPVEIYTEKKHKIKMHETPREKFISLASTSLDDLEAEMIQIMKNMGMSGDFDHYYRTDSEEYRKLTQTTFIQLWKKGLIYEATRPNNYCTDCKTTIADADIAYEELPTMLNYIRFKLKDSDGFITIATTRPELLASCQAIIFNPSDSRYKHMKGMKATIPIFERNIPILENNAAKPEFGTGMLMICSYGDYSDVRLFRELKLKEIIAIDEKGRMTDSAKQYSGLRIEEARRKIIEDLEKMKLIEKRENIIHRTPICERSKTPIEIIPMNEFYLKQIEFKDEIRKLQKKIKFHPEMNRQILLNWIDSISIDWPISRRRFYGTEIPIWYCKKCGKPNIPKEGKYYRPWKEDPPFKKCQFCEGKEFTGETRTFDTWFDSSISPLFISKYETDDEFFKKIFPTTLRPQGKEIVRTWLYYTLLRSFLLTSKQPWNEAWIMGWVVDEKGEKMSKSKGNIIDPLPILEKYGADSFRFWSASEASLGSDMKASEEKVQGASKFLTKLWNIARFISSFPNPKSAKLTKTDEWILAEMKKLEKECKEGYEDFNFFIPANKIREFAWNTFAAHYIEMAKPRAYGQGFNESEQKAAWFTLHECLKNILILLSPICPFVTEQIWMELYGEDSIHLEEFPTLEWKEEYSKITPKLTEFNSYVWDTKKKRAISLKDEIEIDIPTELEFFKKDLKAMHNIKM